MNHKGTKDTKSVHSSRIFLVSKEFLVRLVVNDFLGRISFLRPLDLIAKESLCYVLHSM